MGYSPFGSETSRSRESRGGKMLAEVAQAHGVTAHQVALAFLVRESARVRHSQVGEGRAGPGDAAAAGLRLSPEEVARIDESFPLRKRRGLPTL